MDGLTDWLKVTNHIVNYEFIPIFVTDPVVSINVTMDPKLPLGKKSKINCIKCDYRGERLMSC